MRKYVILLGVGGVGKTTLVYRLAGIVNPPAPTKRPGIYRVFAKGEWYYILDVPGQYVNDIVDTVSRIIHIFFDRALLVYDLTRADTLYALYEIAEKLCLYHKCLSAAEIWVVGNKRDLAARLGVEHKPDLSKLNAQRYVKISAIYDPLERLMELLP
ncbi:Rab family GTPase [Pyrobaculum aerophilum]|uniref:Rab family GTPase n=1 Tax=Pyrobaculum aerophilum TaxID=13773 RepID=UPI0023F21CFB|nr:GTPase domain-containing protein [Pyrobaculum aerophilum]MCX8135601.1 GTPase domain-containing protein [Pyrobaculum aerophilum]